MQANPLSPGLRTPTIRLNDGHVHSEAETPAAASTSKPSDPSDRKRGGTSVTTNFGGNQQWRSTVLRPQNDEDVLEILRQHADRNVRPLGSLHSWSDVAVTPGVNLDMSAFDAVQPFERDGESFVRVGAGCVLQSLLDRLHASTDRTLPTLGAIKRQTISGAISTGTHGSGVPGLSHWVAGVRVAAYDVATGKPRIFEYKDGDELRAARCGLGCTGVVLSVDMRTVPKFLVSETVRQKKTLDEVLSAYKENPLTQFTLIPYRWDYLTFERAPQAERPLTHAEKVKRAFFRVFNKVTIDVGFHLGIKTTLMLGAPFVTGLLKVSPHLLVKNVPHVDTSERILTMGHHYFRHEEMEVFVPERRLQEAVDVLRAATDVFAGKSTNVPPAVEQRLKSIGMYDELMQNHGHYLHHYPFFFRRVMPEDTLISMGSSTAEPYFSISLFTYLAPKKRGAYNNYCDWTARCMNRLFDARLHWGKHFPLQQNDVAPLYPQFDKFRAICENIDPNGVFRNDYTARVLGLPSTARNRR